MERKKEFDIEAFDPNMATGATVDDGIVWLSPDTPPLRIDGFAFRSAGESFRRLKFDSRLPEAVNSLAGHTAGGMISFRSDALKLRIRVELCNTARMDHMPLTGIAGFDLYLGGPGERKFAKVTRFGFQDERYEMELFSQTGREMREFQLNFPLYSGIAALAVGVDAGARLLPPSPWADERPVIYYGSSIAQGGCASRPGSAHTNILSRRFNLQFLNYGFSGSGKGEPEVIEAFAAVPNPRMIVLDYEPNAQLAGIRATLADAVRILRQRHPAVPIVIISAQRWLHELLESGSTTRRNPASLEAIAFERGVVEECRRAGDGNIFFIDGSPLLGDDWYECSVDGTHPTDLGFRRIADALAEPLGRILAQS